MRNAALDRLGVALLFLLLMAVFILGISKFLEPFLSTGLLTRGQVAGLIMALASLFGARWYLSGRLK